MNARLESGQEVFAEIDGSWWGARVVEVLEDGRVRVDPVGLDDSANQDVPRSRIKLPKPAPK